MYKLTVIVKKWPNGCCRRDRCCRVPGETVPCFLALLEAEFSYPLGFTIACLLPFVYSCSTVLRSFSRTAWARINSLGSSNGQFLSHSQYLSIRGLRHPSTYISTVCISLSMRVLSLTIVFTVFSVSYTFDPVPFVPSSGCISAGLKGCNPIASHSTYKLTGIPGQKSCNE